MPYPGPPRTPHEQVPWSDWSMAVYTRDMHTGHGTNGWMYDLAYDDTDANPDGDVCNALADDGHVCRLPRDHWDDLGIGHQKWTPDVVDASGVYVIAAHPPGTVTS